MGRDHPPGCSPGLVCPCDQEQGSAEGRIHPWQQPWCQGRPWLRGSGHGSALQNKYLSSATTRGKEQEDLLPGPRGRFQGAGLGPGGSAVP